MAFFIQTAGRNAAIGIFNLAGIFIKRAGTGQTICVMRRNILAQHRTSAAIGAKFLQVAASKGEPLHLGVQGLCFKQSLGRPATGQCGSIEADGFHLLCIILNFAALCIRFCLLQLRHQRRVIFEQDRAGREITRVTCGAQLRRGATVIPIGLSIGNTAAFGITKLARADKVVLRGFPIIKFQINRRIETALRNALFTGLL